MGYEVKQYTNEELMAKISKLEEEISKSKAKISRLKEEISELKAEGARLDEEYARLLAQKSKKLKGGE